MTAEKRSKIIRIILVGSEGQLDLPEGNYKVRHLEDICTELIKRKDEFKDFGFTKIEARNEDKM